MLLESNRASFVRISGSESLAVSPSIHSVLTTFSKDAFKDASFHPILHLPSPTCPSNIPRTDIRSVVDWERCLLVELYTMVHPRIPNQARHIMHVCQGFMSSKFDALNTELDQLA